MTGLKTKFEQDSLCVTVAGKVSTCFGKIIWLRHRFGMSLWLFNTFIDRVVGEVYSRAIETAVKTVERDRL